MLITNEGVTYIIEAKKHSRLKLDGAIRQPCQMYALTSKEEPEYRSEDTGDIETPFPLIISLIRLIDRGHTPRISTSKPHVKAPIVRPVLNAVDKSPILPSERISSGIRYLWID